MLLKSIKLSGFKSFADATTFEFDHGITGIVGPNGSGKSNLVDAVKWVLGEQKFRSLRAAESTDVIFSGNEHRKAMPMAQVTIVFDNTLNSFRTEGDEVAIARRLYRDGTSEYLINGRKVRLKDVREMILGTGLGVNEYSMIEQGKVDNVIQLSASERRKLLDEAAGILRYKEQRNEAIRRLERVNDNLERLDDILSEVEKQKRSLQYQASRARKYLQLKEELASAKLDMFVLRHRSFSSRHESARSRLVKLDTGYATMLTSYGEVTGKREQLADELARKREACEKLGNEIIRLEGVSARFDTDIEWCEARVEELEHRKKTFSDDQQRIQREISDIEQQLERARNRENELDDARQRKDEVVQQYLEQMRSVDPDIAEARTRLRAAEARRDEERERLMQQRKRAAQVEANLSRAKEQRDWYSRELDGSTDKARKFEKNLVAIEQTVLETRNELKSVVERQKANEKELREVEEQAEHLRSALAELSNERDLAEKRIEQLRKLEKRNADGNDELEGPVLADEVSVSRGWEKAAHALLGAFAEARLASQVAEAGEGRWALEAEIKPVIGACSVPGAIAASKLITSDGPFAGSVAELCSHVFFVEELPDEPPSEPVHLFDRNGAMMSRARIVRPAEDEAEQGRFVMRAEIAELTDQLSELDRRHASLSKEAETLKSRREDFVRTAAECNRLRRRFEVQIHLKNEQRSSIRHEQGALRSSIDEWKEKLKHAEAECERLEAQIGKEEPESDTGSAIREIEKTIAEHRSSLEVLDAKKDKFADALSRARVEAATSAEKLASCRASIDKFERDLSQVRQRAERLVSEVQRADTEIERAREQKDDASAKVVDVSSQLRKTRALLEQRREEQRKLFDRIDKLDREIREREERMESIRSEREDAKLEVHELEVKLEGLAERCMEEMGIKLSDEAQNRVVDDVDEAGLSARIEELERKLRPIRNVNLEAVDLLDEVTERHEFITSQKADLQDSQKSLEELIEQINERCRKMFSDTFERTRLNFNECFRKLFGVGART
ncbi:MAG: chromosome segregation protein SMC [Planctomycetota bacterium]|nr:chromosome segregation protein SMC [Planctomycetota bacterium]